MGGPADATPLLGPNGRVLVLGSEPRMCLAMYRSLGRQGLEVHGTWVAQSHPAQSSRYLHRLHDLPLPALDSDAWIEPLRALLRTHRFDVAMPASEPAVVPLQQNRAAFADHPEIYLIPDDAFRVVSDKDRTKEVARSLGIPVPSSHAVRRGESLDEVLAAVTPPVFVKPSKTARASNVLEKSFAYRVEDVQALRGYVEHLLTIEPEVLIEPIVEGIGVGVELIAADGRVLSALQHQRIHETSGYGSTYRMTVPLTPHLLEAAAALVRELAYTGVAMVEFRVDPDTQRWVLLEVNGRFWGSLPLAVGAGADFPFWLYRMRVEGLRSFPRRYQVGVRSRNLDADLRWTRRAFLRVRPSFPPAYEDELGWAVNMLPRGRILAHALRGLVGLDRTDTRASDDPAPHRSDLLQVPRTLAGWVREKLGA